MLVQEPIYLACVEILDRLSAQLRQSVPRKELLVVRSGLAKSVFLVQSKVLPLRIVTHSSLVFAIHFFSWFLLGLSLAHSEFLLLVEDTLLQTPDVGCHFNYPLLALKQLRVGFPDYLVFSL